MFERVEACRDGVGDLARAVYVRRCGHPEIVRLGHDQAQVSEVVLLLMGCAARCELTAADHHLHDLTAALGSLAYRGA